MKPVLIFRHIACEGPGYLADFLDSHHIEYEIICIDEGDSVPDSLDKCSGLVFMGGPMSVNDPLPWVEAELDLISRAHKAGIPVLGHCLGGQLICKALGGEIHENLVREIGWFDVEKYESCLATYWLQELPGGFEVFHMHGERFSIPVGATLLLKSRFCEHQAFSIGNTLALQFHVEVTEKLIQEWVVFYSEDLANPSASVQSGNEIMDQLNSRIANVNRIAESLYNVWIKNL